LFLSVGFGAITPRATAAVKYELGNAAPFCKEFRLGRWTFENSRDPDHNDELHFRWKDGKRSELLVRSTSLGLWEFVSREVYTLNLGSGRVYMGTSQEWNHGSAVEPFGWNSKGAYCESDSKGTNRNDPLWIDGREIPKAGEFWPGTACTSAIPSPRKTWIVVQSYSGKVQNSVERWGAEFGHLIRGTGYVQLLRMKDAKELFRILVQVRNEFPDQFVTGKPWLEEDLLVLDMFPDRKRLLVCRID
jgi:hypothetical protein